MEINIWNIVQDTNALFPSSVWIALAIIFLLFSSICVLKPTQLLKENRRDYSHYGVRYYWSTFLVRSDEHSGWIYLWTVLSLFCIYIADYPNVNNYIGLAAGFYLLLGVTHMIVHWRVLVDNYTKRLKISFGSETATFVDSLQNLICGSTSVINKDDLKVTSLVSAATPSKDEEAKGIQGKNGESGIYRPIFDMDKLFEEISVVPNKFSYQVMDQKLLDRAALARDLLNSYVKSVTGLSKLDFEFIPNFYVDTKQELKDRKLQIRFDVVRTAQLPDTISRVLYSGTSDQVAKCGIIDFTKADIEYLKQNMNLKVHEHIGYLNSLFLAWPAYTVRFACGDLITTIRKLLGKIFGSVFKYIANRTSESI